MSLRKFFDSGNIASRHFFSIGLFVLSFFALSVFLLPRFSFAASAPAIITYQGKLASVSTGASVTTTQSMYFVLYSAASGGTILYTASGTIAATSSISVTPSSAGIFSVNLGDTGTNSLDATIFQNNSAVYLEVRIGSETLSPRKQMTASPYAFNAKYLDGYFATSTPTTTTYIPVADASGNFNFNHITSTGMYASGTAANPLLWGTQYGSGSLLNLSRVTSSATVASSTFVVDNSGFVAIGTSTPEFRLTIDGSNDGSIITRGPTVAQVAAGASGTSLTTSGDGARLIWYAKKAAFRAGAVSGTQWNDANVGLFSSALGLNTQASGFASFAFGSSTSATATNTFAFGQNITVSGTSSFGLNVSSTSYTVSNANIIALLGGNVGIGTTTPTSLLSVGGNTLLGDSVSSQTTIRGGLLLGSASTEASLTGTAGNMYYNTTNNKFRCYENGAWMNCVTLNGVSGQGTAGQLAFWDADSTIAGNSAFRVSTSTGRVTLGSNTSAQTTSQFHVEGVIPTAADTSTPTGVFPEGLFVQGRYAYVVNLSSSTLQIFDVSSSTNPAVRSSISVGGTGPVAVHVQGRYAYVTGGGILQIFDISNPSSPTSMSTLTVSSSPNGAIYVQGSFAYLAVSSSLQVVNISNPSAPTTVATTNIVGGGNNPTAVFVQGRYAYLVASSTLSFFDVSYPPAPILVASTSIIQNPTGLYVQGRYAYVVNNITTSSLSIYDISNPSSGASSVGTVQLPTAASSVYVQGRYAYVTNVNDLTFKIIDVANVASPTVLGTIDTLSTPKQVRVQGRYAYITCASNDILQIFDLGGAYIQQLEAGGIETGTLSLRNSLYGVDGAFSGGLAVGSGLNISGSLGISGTSTFVSNVIIGTTTPPSTNYRLYVDSGTSTAAGIGVNGYIKASGFITGTTTLDLAETYPVDPACQFDNSCPEAGDAVCLSDGQRAAIKKCSDPYSEKMIGIISTNPGFTLGGFEDETSRRVALAGRVPIKFSTKNGTIKAGDKLTTSDIPGVAMKALDAGATIAVALEDFGDPTSSTINTGMPIVFVKMGWWPAPVITPPPSIATTTTSTASLAVTALVQNIIDALKTVGIIIEQGIIRATEFIADKITTNQLCIGGTCISEIEWRNLLGSRYSNSVATSTIPAISTSASVDASISFTPATTTASSTIDAIVVTSTNSTITTPPEPTVVIDASSSAATTVETIPVETAAPVVSIPSVEQPSAPAPTIETTAVETPASVIEATVSPTPSVDPAPATPVAAPAPTPAESPTPVTPSESSPEVI